MDEEIEKLQTELISDRDLQKFAINLRTSLLLQT